MAIIRSIVGELSGSILGTTYSRNRGGPYIRGRRTPTNPTSLRQSQVRYTLSVYSHNWSAVLTEGQRDAWRSWASTNTVTNALGDAINLTGQQAYVSVNARLVDSGLAAVTSPPVSPGGGAEDLEISPSLVIGSGTISLVFTPAAPLAVGERIQMLWTGWNSLGSDPNRNQARVLGYVASTNIVGGEYLMPLPSEAPASSKTNLYWRVILADGSATAFNKVPVVAEP